MISEDVDGVHLVENEMRQEADEQEAAGEPGDAIGPIENVVEMSTVAKAQAMPAIHECQTPR